VAVVETSTPKQNPNVYLRGRECCISNNGNTLCGSRSAGPHFRQSTVCGNIRMMSQLRKYEPQYSWQLGISVKTILEHFAEVRIPLKMALRLSNFVTVSHIFTLHCRLFCCRKRQHASSNYGFFLDRHSRSVLCGIRTSRGLGFMTTRPFIRRRHLYDKEAPL